MAAENYYEVLGLRPGANDEDVKQAFRELAKVLHPDRNPGDQEAERRFKLVNTAYEALKDASRRRAYDEWLAFARKHERSRLAQSVRLAALVAVLLVGPSLALYWALVFLDLAGPRKERPTVSTAIETPARNTATSSRPAPAPKTEAARLPDPAPPVSAPPTPPRESVAVLEAPPVIEPPANEDPTASIAPQKRADGELEEPASPPDSRPKGPSRDREEPGSPPDTRTPGASSGESEEQGKPRDDKPSRPSRDFEEPRSLKSVTGANEGNGADNAPSRTGEYLPPASGASNAPAPTHGLSSDTAPSPDGDRDTPARSMARMIAELKEPGAVPQDRTDETPQRHAALPDERRAQPSAGEPEDFADCERCPVMSLVEATDIAPTPGARRPLPTRTLAISKSEVTVAEWNACVEDGACRGFRQYGASTHKPILDVTRTEALDYASWLSRKTGKIYRPMKTGGWNRTAGAGGRRGDCLSGDPQRWMDEDCDTRAQRGQRGQQGSGGFRVARTLGPDD